MKKIAEQKLQAFSIGSMGARTLSKRELEEQRKKQEEEAAAHVFQEFVETFQEAPSKTSKVWVKAGTYDAGARREDTSERGKLYKPVSRLPGEGERDHAAEAVRALASRPPDPPAKHRKHRDSHKKKSNLQLFKEELQKIQEERSERHKYKGVLRGAGVLPAPPGVANADSAALDAALMSECGSYDTGDPNTTNLYLGNLNPKITEQQLMEVFGRYGPLASIKIMWPRSDEEKARGRNCGFVAFMSRRDGERALARINGKEVMNYEMKLGWGKAVVIPPVPIYIPPSLQQPSKPPPPSGLPFNAQPPRHLSGKIPRVRAGESYPGDPEDRKLFDQVLAQSIVKVVVPTERNILMLIHRMVEFVIREGPMFEAMIMNKEINNPFFRFLFENQSSAHVYYRWKLFSLLQGDSPKSWQLNDFRMFKGGSVWRPPVMNMYTAGMPEELVEEDDVKDNIRGTLSNNQRERLEELVRALRPERGAVGEAMAWCLEHAEAAGEVAACLCEALTGPGTHVHKRLARLYLLSDVLHNAGAKLANASAYRKEFQQRLEEVMRAAHAAWRALESRLQQEGYRARVTRVLQAWADWAVYPTDFLLRLNNAFLGLEADAGVGVSAPQRSPAPSTGSEGESWEEEPLDGAALRRLAAGAAAAPATPPAPSRAPRSLLDDIDGVPLDEDIDGVPMEGGGVDEEPATPCFVPSKWESVEPEALEAGAVTTSQWARVSEPGSVPRSPPPPAAPALTPGRASDSADAGEWAARRALLRDVEVRVLRYQDELESGRRAPRPGLTHAQQIQHYRKKLLKKMAREAKEKEEEGGGSPELASDESYVSSSKKAKKSREVSVSPPPPPAKRSRHRSVSRGRDRSERETRRRRSPSPAPRRRSPSPAHAHSRRHKHKHKY